MSERVRDRTKANPNARGTSNGNDRGSAEQRRRRKEYLLEAYAADVQLIRVTWAATDAVTVDHFVITAEELATYVGVVSAETVPTARCYRCGDLLWFETISVDRIKPGCKGGTYHRHNIRPACDDCQSKTGNEQRVKHGRMAQRRNRPVRVVAP